MNNRTKVFLGLAAVLAAIGIWRLASMRSAPAAVAPDRSSVVTVSDHAPRQVRPVGGVAASTIEPRVHAASTTAVAAPTATPAPAPLALNAASTPSPDQPRANPELPAPAASTDALANSNPTGPANEVVATRRMIQAHAPLRTPEVSDPNSDANRQILQTMVAKALARANDGSSERK